MHQSCQNWSDTWPCIEVTHHLTAWAGSQGPTPESQALHNHLSLEAINNSTRKHFLTGNKKNIKFNVLKVSCMRIINFIPILYLGLSLYQRYWRPSVCPGPTDQAVCGMCSLDQGMRKWQSSYFTQYLW